MTNCKISEKDIFNEDGKKIGTYRYANVDNIYENLAYTKEQQFEICKRMLDVALVSKPVIQQKPVDTLEFFNHPYKKTILGFRTDDWNIDVAILDREKVEKDSNQLAEDFLNSDFGLSYHKKHNDLRPSLWQRIKNLFK